MSNRIQEIVQKISNDVEQKEYFFNNLDKMKSPKAWFEALYQANLLTPDNASAIAYIRILISQGMMSNQNFLRVVTNWLDSFLKPDSPFCNVIWFIEEVIKLNDSSLNQKCRKVLINKLSNSNTFNETANAVVYRNQINNFIFIDKDTIIQILEIIIHKDKFSTISRDVHILLKLREQISEFLINQHNSEYLPIVLNQLLPYIDTKPVEFLMVDTIDSGYYSFSYGDFLIGFLINIIDGSSEQDNEALIEQLVQYIVDPKTEYFKKVIVFKIIIYIIDKIKKYELIMKVINLIHSLEELSAIKYAMYHCIIKKCADKWYTAFPNFDDWLSELDYSEQYKLNCENKDMLNNWGKQTKLSLLHPFKANNSLYSDLIRDYPYNVQEPTKSFEIKSSWESPNNYVDILQNSSIADIVEYMNGTRKIPSESDFPDIHLDEAFSQDFNSNNEKYISKLQYIFQHLNSTHYKSKILYKLADLARKQKNSNYQEILNNLLNDDNIDKHYFDAILSLLCAITDKNAEQLLSFEDVIYNFLINHIAFYEDRDDMDDLAGGRNSLSGKCLDILIKLSIAKDNTLLGFANNINNYKIFLDNPNGLLIIGQYLFWLFKHEQFLQYFNNLEIKAQNIALSTYFKYSRYVQKKIFNLSIQNNFIEVEKNIHPYINHAMYFYLTDENNYLFSVLKSQLQNENLIEAITSALNTYNGKIIKLNAKNKLIDIWELILISPILNKIASRILYNSNLIDIRDNKAKDLFYKTIGILTLHSIIYENEAVKLLYKLMDDKQFEFVLNTLLSLANNSRRTYYMDIEYLDKILITFNNQNFKLFDINREKFIKLVARLKEINYPVPVKIKS
ncbi:MAG: hypothetical protein K2Q03_02550 [Sphingobacteriaceae bacterium]|nr:hypothetical protein [Sphingobacteriaceae bacterium]